METSVSVSCGVGAAIDMFRDGWDGGGGPRVPEGSDRWRVQARRVQGGCDFQLFRFREVSFCEGRCRFGISSADL